MITKGCGLLDREDVMMDDTILILIIFYRNNKTKVIFNFSEYLAHFQPFIYNLPTKNNNKQPGAATTGPGDSSRLSADSFPRHGSKSSIRLG